MKVFYILILAVLTTTCISNQVPVADTLESYTKSSCPEDGTCSFEVLKNRNLIVKTDEYGNRYKEIVSGDNIVLKFEYKRNELPDTEDSSYTEEIYIVLNPDEIEIKLENSELKQANLLFGRLCFCRGQTGYYQIDIGALSVVKLTNGSYQLNLEFKCEAVPQIIETLNETFKL